MTIDIDPIVNSIELWLKNHVHPDDLTKDEQLVMRMFKGEDWKKFYLQQNFTNNK